MSNINPTAVKQMAAICAALPMLLSGDRKIRDLNVIGGTKFPENHGDYLANEIKQGRSTLMVTFVIDGAEAVVDKMLFLHVPCKKKRVLSISYCSFVRSEDGRFALRLAGRDEPTESVFSYGSTRLVTRAVENDAARAMAELNGFQALLAKAATPECQENAYQVV